MGLIFKNTKFNIKITKMFSRTCNSKKYKNLSYIIFFNYDKKNYYINKCLKPKKNHNVIKN